MGVNGVLLFVSPVGVGGGRSAGGTGGGRSVFPFISCCVPRSPWCCFPPLPPASGLFISFVFSLESIVVNPSLCRPDTFLFLLSAPQLDGDIGTVGITDFAQNSLGDIVYVDLPEVGDRFGGEEEFGSVESVKAASDVYNPIAGEVTEVNENLADNPGLVNESPTGEGWFMKVKVDDPSAVEALLDEAAYQALCDAEAH